MKMMFWKDTIEQIFAGKPPQQPVALALSHSLQFCDLSPMWFKRVISEREKNLDDPQFMTVADMETYAENTASALLYLQLEALGIKDVHADHAATHIGKASGIATFLRGIPFHASQRRMMLPAEITAKHGISQEDVFRHGEVEHLSDAIFEVATTAHDHLLTARTFLPNLPPAAYPALINAIPCDVFLKKLEKADFQIFNPKLAVREWKLPYIIWRRNRSMTF
ncbi:hypothetical protein K493DRAFT_323585 [Basidiobolus meristosporus CBS 931.73]|uniref:Terpenoid synthase n=1 Tax=Basidiobolus meristosporus CBS 931.73 TaxID=1314790 RepID=A0A1Y1YSN2_9FUNG|nr:hypothetical protein K493DRAFT_323585 [Basidiobolus meristosporus CBS 931.73]|eukprot:ORY00834.1 hypothetical protein K493DRAFT_323585 [Basidiobolus meristosporus CBS 931.73]